MTKPLDLENNDYKYGFTTDIETDKIPVGLSEDVVRLISAKRGSRNGFSTSASKHTATG